MSVITWDSSAVWDTAGYSWDGVRLAGSRGLGYEVFLFPRPRVRLTDRDVELDGPDPHGDLSRGWDRRGGLA
jgi:hypothetical protein